MSGNGNGAFQPEARNKPQRSLMAGLHRGGQGSGELGCPLENKMTGRGPDGFRPDSAVSEAEHGRIWPKNDSNSDGILASDAQSRRSDSRTAYPPEGPSAPRSRLFITKPAFVTGIVRRGCRTCHSPDSRKVSVGPAREYSITKAAATAQKSNK